MRNFLVDLFWVERSWQDFFGLMKNERTSRFSILCRTLAEVHLQTLRTGLLDLFGHKNLAPFAPPRHLPPGFQLRSENNSRLLWSCFTSFCDWCHFSTNEKEKNKTNRPFFTDTAATLILPAVYPIILD